MLILVTLLAPAALPKTVLSGTFGRKRGANQRHPSLPIDPVRQKLGGRLAPGTRGDTNDRRRCDGLLLRVQMTADRNRQLRQTTEGLSALYEKPVTLTPGLKGVETACMSPLGNVAQDHLVYGLGTTSQFGELGGIGL